MYDTQARDIGAARVYSGCGQNWTSVWSHLSTRTHVYANIYSQVIVPQECSTDTYSSGQGCQTPGIDSYTVGDSGVATAQINDPYDGKTCVVFFNAGTYNGFQNGAC